MEMDGQNGDRPYSIVAVGNYPNSVLHHVRTINPVSNVCSHQVSALTMTLTLEVSLNQVSALTMTLTLQRNILIAVHTERQYQKSNGYWTKLMHQCLRKYSHSV